MHRQLVILLLTALVFAAPGVAHAKPCTTQGAPSPTALPLDEPKSLAGLMTNLGVWLTALADRGFERNLQKMGGACERTAFEAAGRQYVLRGENGGQVADRLALASSRGAPLAYVMAVPDLVAALKGGGGAQPVILGYALLTAEGGRHTAWRVYSAVPPDDVLVADIRLALAGQTRPAMYWQNGKVQIVTPAAQQTTSGAPAGAAVRLKSKLSADRVRAFIEAAYMLGHCKAAASGTRQRLEDMVRLENLRLEPADEPQREAVARVMADARATAAKAGAGSERECQENLGRNVQKVSALP